MEKLFEIVLQKAIDHGGIDFWFFLFVLVVGMAVYVLKKNGIITFGRPSGRRRCDKYCDDHKLLKAQMDSHEGDLAEIESGATGNFEKLEKLIEGIYHKMDEFNKTLSDHIGYCRGVQTTKTKQWEKQ